MWLYLNPFRDEQVEKASVFDFLLVLMFNVTNLSEREMTSCIARFLVSFYDNLDINIQKSEIGDGNTDLIGLGSSVHSYPSQLGSESQQSQSIVCNEV